MTSDKLNKYNNEIADKLGCDLLKITYKVSNTAKSKFGHCRFIEENHYLINISSFILDTPLEDDTIKHELCHAYDDTYFRRCGYGDGKPHGVVWKQLMEKVFNYTDVRAQGIHSRNMEVIKNNNCYDLYENGIKRAIFTIDKDGSIEIRDDKNELFSNIANEEYYVNQFINKLHKQIN